jgi:CshA-type fibril repeat protein
MSPAPRLPGAPSRLLAQLCTGVLLAMAPVLGAVTASAAPSSPSPSAEPTASASPSTPEPEPTVAAEPTPEPGPAAGARAVADNVAPVAVDDAEIHVEHTLCTPVPLLANDTDADGDPLVVLAAEAEHGQVLLMDEGAAPEYCSDYRWRGPDTVRYTVSDGRGGTDTAEATVITANAPPEAWWWSREDVPGDVPSRLDLRGHTTDVNGDELTLTVGEAEHGRVALEPDGTAVYTPEPRFAGDDAFPFTVDDGHGGRVTVTALLHVEALLRAEDDRAVTAQDQPVTVDVLANDTAGEMAELDPDTLVLPDPTGFSVDPQERQVPGVGVYAVVGSAVVFTPEPGFTGTTTTPYQISQVVNRPAPARVAARAAAADDDPDTAEALLTITVTATDDAPPPGPDEQPDPDEQADPEEQPGRDEQAAPPAAADPSSAPAPARPAHADGAATLASTGGPTSGVLLAGLVAAVLGTVSVLVGRGRRP